MASVDEAYIDMTGTDACMGRRCVAANQLHRKMKAETQLNCSIGLAVRDDSEGLFSQSQPNGILWGDAGEEARFSRR